MSDNTNTTTKTTIDGMEVTLVGTFNIRWKDYVQRVTWDIWGEVFSLPDSEGVVVLARDPEINVEVNIFDHTRWGEEDPKYTEEDL